jgi:ABC-type phosphate transport system permease subunit
MLDTLISFAIALVLAYVLMRRGVPPIIIGGICLAIGLLVGYEATRFFPPSQTSYYYLLQSSPMRIAAQATDADIYMAISMQPYIKWTATLLDGFMGLIAFVVAKRLRKKQV